MELIILTGLSGSGKSTALKTLEDLDFFTMDNIPFRYAGTILHDFQNSEKNQSSLKKVALGLDIRTLLGDNDFETFFNHLENLKINYKIVFLESSIQAIINRYNLTRRKHPLSKGTLYESISSEISLMKVIKDKANVIIDTTYLSGKDLSNKIKQIVSNYSEQTLINIHIQSFGFKHGVPIDSDMIFDVRTLPNPYYIPELKEKTGMDNDVFNYVMDFDVSKELYSKIKDLILFTLPGYIKDGKKHLTIAFGCSGGKHRSVTFARKLYEDLSSLEHLQVNLTNREQERGNW